MGSATLVNKLGEALTQEGVNVQTSFDLQPPANDFDVIHTFDLHCPSALHLLLDHCQPNNCPLVLTPLYHTNLFEYYWSERAITNIFSAQVSEPQRQQWLSQLADRSLKITTSAGQTLTHQSVNRSSQAAFALPRSALDRISYWLVNSHMEIRDIVQTLHCRLPPFRVMRLAVDEPTLPGPELFVQKYGVKDFVLEVGHVFHRKNQLMLCYACRDLDVPLVMIGNTWNKQYATLCHLHASGNTLFLPQVSRDELLSAFCAARVHVLPSWAECCGLVSLEAALADCSVVLSTAGHEMEYFSNLGYYCDPADYQSIRRAVVQAFDQYHEDGERREELKTLIKSQYTWKHAAQEAVAVYEQARIRAKHV